MAITTDSMNAVSSGGVNYDFYGLSKTLNNYSFDEIFDYVFCSASSNLIYHVGYGSNTMNYYTYEAQESALGGHVPFQMDYVPVNKNVIHYPLDTPLNQPDGLYMKMIWLQRTSNGSDDFVYTGNAGNYKLITEFNAPHYVYEANTPQKVKEYYGSDSWADGGYMYYSNGGYLYYYDNVTSESPLRINIPRVIPALIFKDANGNGFIIMYKQRMMDFVTMRNTQSSGWGTPETSAYFPSYDSSVKIAFPLTVELIYQFMNSTTGEMSSPQPDGSYANDGQTGGYSRPFYSLTIKEHLMSIWDFGGSNYYPLGFHQKCYFRTVEECKKFYALAGLHFKADKIYKPIIEGGYVTGFTDALDTPSDIDNWDGKTQHAVPVTPPGPAGGNENKEIEMPLAYIGGTGGFVQFIKINSAGLASADDISAALSRFDITTIGKDLLRNFISYKCFAILSIDPDDTVTRQIKVDGHALTDENNNPLNGQVIGSVLPIDFEIGTPTRYFNDFRDYAPYTKIEAYVPFCGWFALPSWCIGHKITGTMFTDLYNGTVKAVIYASQTVVAEVGGCCAYDIPFVADATGAKAGAVISSALSTAAATAATVSMPNIATGIAAVTSAANTISAVNSNDTTLKGVLGDGSNLNGLLHCYLKITRPQSPTRDKVVPDSYKHEYGIPTYKAITLTSGDGYTQVMNANITGAMTDREKQMIIDGFRHGLIL